MVGLEDLKDNWVEVVVLLSLVFMCFTSFTRLLLIFYVFIGLALGLLSSFVFWFGGWGHLDYLFALKRYLFLKNATTQRFGTIVHAKQLVSIPSIRGAVKILIDPRSFGKVKYWSWAEIEQDRLVYYDDHDTKKKIPLDNSKVTLIRVQNSNWKRKNYLEVSHSHRKFFGEYKCFYVFLKTKRELEEWYYGLERAIRNNHNYIRESSVYSRLAMDNFYDSWFNAVVHRLFSHYHEDPVFINEVTLKFKNKFDSIRKPQVIKSMEVEGVKFSQNFPCFSNIELAGCKPDGTLDILADVHYKGGFSLKLNITVEIKLFSFDKRIVPCKLVVNLNSFQGKAHFHISGPPADRCWMSFDAPPKFDLTVETQISVNESESYSNLPPVATLIKEILLSEVTSKTVEMDDVSFPKLGDIDYIINQVRCKLSPTDSDKQSYQMNSPETKHNPPSLPSHPPKVSEKEPDSLKGLLPLSFAKKMSEFEKIKSQATDYVKAHVLKKELSDEHRKPNINNENDVMRINQRSRELKDVKPPNNMDPPIPPRVKNPPIESTKPIPIPPSTATTFEEPLAALPIAKDFFPSKAQPEPLKKTEEVIRETPKVPIPDPDTDSLFDTSTSDLFDNPSSLEDNLWSHRAVSGFDSPSTKWPTSPEVQKRKNKDTPIEPPTPQTTLPKVDQNKESLDTNQPVPKTQTQPEPEQKEELDNCQTMTTTEPEQKEELSDESQTITTTQPEQKQELSDKSQTMTTQPEQKQELSDKSPTITTPQPEQKEELSDKSPTIATPQPEQKEKEPLDVEPPITDPQIVQQKESADIGQSDKNELPDTTQTITTTQPDKEEKELHDNEPSIPKDKDESLELSQTDQTKEGVDMGQPIPISPTEPEKDKELIIPTSISQLDQEQIPLGQTDIQPEEHYPSNSPLENPQNNSEVQQSEDKEINSNQLVLPNQNPNDIEIPIKNDSISDTANTKANQNQESDIFDVSDEDDLFNIHEDSQRILHGDHSNRTPDTQQSPDPFTANTPVPVTVPAPVIVPTATVSAAPVIVPTATISTANDTDSDTDKKTETEPFSTKDITKTTSSFPKGQDYLFPETDDTLSTTAQIPDPLDALFSDSSDEEFFPNNDFETKHSHSTQIIQEKSNDHHIIHKSDKDSTSSDEDYLKNNEDSQDSETISKTTTDIFHTHSNDKDAQHAKHSIFDDPDPIDFGKPSMLQQQQDQQEENSIFKSSTDDIFPSSSRSRNNSKDNSKATTKQQKDLFEDLQSPPRRNSTSKSIFDSLEAEGLSSSGLFSSSNGETIVEKIFTSRSRNTSLGNASSSNPAKKTFDIGIKNPDPLFDVDEETEELFTPIPKKLTLDTHKITIIDDTTPTTKTHPQSNPLTTKSSLDIDSELFGTEGFNPPGKTKSVPKETDLFGDDTGTDDLFLVKPQPKRPSSEKPNPLPETKTSAITEIEPIPSPTHKIATKPPNPTLNDSKQIFNLDLDLMEPKDNKNISKFDSWKFDEEDDDEIFETDVPAFLWGNNDPQKKSEKKNWL